MGSSALVSRWQFNLFDQNYWMLAALVCKLCKKKPYLTLGHDKNDIEWHICKAFSSRTEAITHLPRFHCFIHNLQRLLGRDNGIFSVYFLHSFFFFLVKKCNLHHNLGHNYFKGCRRSRTDPAFLNSISAKMNATN